MSVLRLQCELVDEGTMIIAMQMPEEQVPAVMFAVEQAWPSESKGPEKHWPL